MPTVFESLSPDDPREIGGYRIVARLGAGGMGRVYLGATQSGRRLAVKVVRPEFSDDPEFRRRFQQEVAAAQRVQSLYTAPVIDADPVGPMPWLATAHVPGPSLAAAVMENGPLPPETVRLMASGVAEALLAIHRAGVIHRDLKPSNVLLAADGPKVIDFGIARAADATPLTRTGGSVGSPQFMAPEQVRGETSTPALDVFAFGSLVHFAATGRSPFGDGPAQAVMFRIVQDEPRLDGLPAELTDLVRRCLAKDPAARPPVQEILDELTAAPPPTLLDGWLPAGVTARLADYAAPPTPPPPAHTPPPPTYAPAASLQHPTGPGGPHAPAQPGWVPAGPPAARGGSATRVLLAVLTAVVLVLGVTVAVLVGTRDKDEPGKSSANPTNIVAQQPVEGAEDPAAVPTTTASEPDPAASESASSTPAATTSVPAGAVPGTRIGEYKGINITQSYGISFTLNPKRPHESRDDDDLKWRGGYFDGHKFGKLTATAPATYDACHDNTIYSSSSDYDPPTGTRLCVYTEAGLLGLVTVRGVGSNYVSIDLLVFQGPADQ